MARWKVVVAKAAILMAAAMAMLGVIALLLVSTLGNGSAIGSDEFSWTYAVISLCVVGSQGWSIPAGCLSAWRWVDARNEKVHANSG
jgi:hypothetical protein